MKYLGRKDYSEMNRICKAIGLEGKDGQYSKGDFNLDLTATATNLEAILYTIIKKIGGN